ncbi:hypothetical protein, partial [Agrobacterium salinitolerans]|uniref:hypothetical protein n=1 Tax=Agrobacterium salinitolerans TaxID=1183413 RepID=UPI00195D70E8
FNIKLIYLLVIGRHSANCRSAKSVLLADSHPLSVKNIQSTSAYILYFLRWLLYKYMFAEATQIATGLPYSYPPSNQNSPSGCANIAS